MTLEELKKHAKPLRWCEFGNELARPIDHIAQLDFIEMNEDGTWLSNYDRKSYPTKEEAMQSVEEYHLRELAKFFELEDEPK
jgi:hypothetical protein